MVQGLDVEYGQRLLSLVDSPKPNNDKLSSKSDWLLDSGVACHMIVDLNKLIELHDSHLIFVKIPNRQNSVANKLGVIKLSSSKTLLNVMFVHSFTCTLI